jgi:peptide chain release factor subunit 1
MSRELTDEQKEVMEKNIQKFKLKKLIKSLESARGIGTSVITLLIPPKQQISQPITMLNNEFGTCSNIKSHTNKLSVQSAITATLGRLKLVGRVPPNGLIVYCGTVLTEDNKEKKMTLDIEPFKAVSRSMYMCDNKFHTDELRRMLESDDKFGFIIVDGSGTYYYSVCGQAKEKLGSFTVELPKKHGRGGQSKNRFARIRQERRAYYLLKVSEGATQVFTKANVPTVTGIILAGNAEFKEALWYSEHFNPILKNIVVKIVDIQHTGEVGLNQAIEGAADALGNLRLVAEKKLLTKFYEEIASDTGMYCFTANDTMKCIEMGAVATLMVWEEMEVNRYTVTPPDESAPTYFYLTAKEAKKVDMSTSPEGMTGNNKIECEELVDYLTENYMKFGCTLELVSNKTQEGMQFVRGFGGIGGVLRYKVDLLVLSELEKGIGAESDEDIDIEDDFM